MTTDAKVRNPRHLAKIRIENYQSHPDSTIEFNDEPGELWTTLIGESNVGKTAALRAFTSAATNETGSDFIRNGAKKCVVTITLFGGHVITWTKPLTGGSTYTLTDPDGKVETFQKTGSKVPEPIANLIGIEATVGPKTYRPGVQIQPERMFMVDQSPRDRAKIIGAIDGSNTTIAAATDLKSQQTKANATATAQREIVATSKARVERFAGVEAARAAVEAARTAETKSIASDSASDAMSADVTMLTLTTVNAQVATRQRDAWALSIEVDPERVADKLRQAETIARAADDLESAVTESDRLTRRRDAHGVDHVFDLDGMAETVRTASAMLADSDQLRAAIAQVATTRQTATEAAEATHGTADELAALVGQPCPFCGAPMPEGGPA